MNHIYTKVFVLSLSVSFKLDSDLFNSTKNTKQIGFRVRQHLFVNCNYIFLVCMKLTAPIVQSLQRTALDKLWRTPMAHFLASPLTSLFDLIFILKPLCLLFWRGCVGSVSVPRLRNHIATDDGNVDFRTLRRNFTFEAWKINVKWLIY